MDYEKYIELGLNGDAPLKVIMRGCAEKTDGSTVGVVSIVFATTDKELAKKD